MLEQVSEKILVVDDEPKIRNLLNDALSMKGYTVILAENGYEALDVLKRNSIAAVITDVKMPRMSGLVLLKKIKQLSSNVPVVVITGHETVNDAVETMKCGASDYLPKPFSVSKVHEVVEGLIGNGQSTEALSKKIITADPGMKEILETIDIAAKTNANVFIQGESGTGKELVARAIHDRGERRNKRFVSINCAALPETLLESELFGHEQGAFTGAVTKRIGRFEYAHRGTLLLDEIAEMPPASQARLLRCIQECEIVRLGDNVPIKVDVSIIATTNRDIGKEIKEQRFREDLFYRLCVVQIVVPPLRNRKEDIPILIDHFLNEFSRQYEKSLPRVSEDGMRALEAYNWPGNVRELENKIQRAVMFSYGDALSVDDLFPNDVLSMSGPASLEYMENTLYESVKRLIMSTLVKVNGNKVRAALILGVTPRTIRNKLHKYTEEDKK